MISKKLKFCSWNIQGYSSRLIGNKFEDKEFLKIFEDVDFIGLTETHMYAEVLDKMNIPGFHRLHTKNQPKNKKSNTASKGIAVFVRENIKGMFKLVQMGNDDAIWVKMIKEKSGESKDIFIGTCYLNPSRCHSTDQKISKLSEDIVCLQGEGEVIINGDFNARTGGLEDTISPDKSDILFDISFATPPPKRNSRDIEIDQRGRDLVELCKSLDLRIVNGRKTGDLFGDYTCIKYNGNSLVDYLVTSSSTFENISSFNVGDFLPWLSDHCPVFFTLEVQNCTMDAKSSEKRTKTKAPKQYIWSDESKENFRTMINTPEIKSKLDRSVEVDHSDPNLLVNYVSDILVDSAQRADVRCRRFDGISDPPWFDRACRDLKDSIKTLGKKNRKNAKSESLKSELYAKKKELKRLIRSNKLKYKSDLMDQMNQSKNDSRKFWKLLDKMEQKKDDTVSARGISDHRWVSHFRSVFQDPGNNKPFPKNTKVSGDLDRDVSDHELKLASYILRNGKAPGFDSISNEMLQCFLEARPDILRRVFNSILNNPRVIEKWSISMINPLHKAGSKMDPDNYRGISLLSCFSKFFTAILNLRLTQYAIDTNIFSRSQLGFMAGCRTADALFILNNLIEYYCKKKGEYIYGCFVDFKKAFDSVPRHTLFQKLLDYNINGRFYDCLVNIYSNDIACIKIADSITPTFIANQGVKQGCILSPTLFNIFLADFQPMVETAACDPVQIREGGDMGCLIWADDLLLMSKSKAGMDNMLSALGVFSGKNGMTLNIKKTKIMTFNKGGRHIRGRFFFGGEAVETTREYKYLGFLVTPSGEITSGLRDLRDRALRAFCKLKKKMGINFRKRPSITIKLFRSLIEPILLYASDFWGVLKMPSNNPIETLFMSFCKQLLGVQKQSANDGVLLELGQFPLLILAKKRAIKNWVRMAANTGCSEVLRESYRGSVDGGLLWASNMEALLSGIGLMQAFVDRDPGADLKAFQRLQDIYHQTVFERIKNGGGRLRTYALFKTAPGFEKYLDDVACIKERTALTKLRISNHVLMIEKGRHQNMDRDARFCPFCPNRIEDEKHFLITCPIYGHLRAQLYSEAKLIFPTICNQPYDFRLVNLMRGVVAAPVSRFTFKAIELREFLLAGHRVQG